MTTFDLLAEQANYDLVTFLAALDAYADHSVSNAMRRQADEDQRNMQAAYDAHVASLMAAAA